METSTVHKKTLRGTVVSTKMQDTAVVEVSRYVKHPKYKKYMKSTKRYHAHNPGNRAQEGEKVTIRSCRPMSKTKSFEIVFE
ncbi:MAG TPA: 30S ribosomal protein S17 [Candidatus Paceibacterota bacterium]|nr:30S ribosomal protein S17 [Candidatus Paceibacterota bacterium]